MDDDGLTAADIARQGFADEPGNHGSVQQYGTWSTALKTSEHMYVGNLCQLVEPDIFARAPETENDSATEHALNSMPVRLLVVA